ncbi:type II secretion system protein GspL [Ideonella alba]|uniref:General secretion pathway protein GspL n=1 Tax=Ideonella alba TaxID=2824118 RepID=A0A941BGI9_9BURK|nr:type II secretion system protein GspL [Ideonella alba]MBQ0930588.1 general secretion pathway protein GspL [Ideonella alba]
MSILIVLLPAPPRLSVQAPPQAPAEGAAPEWDWVLASDTRQLIRQGRDPLERLPRAGSVVAVLPPEALSWHRLPVPKAPAARLRAALAGLLEESLLEDEADLHLALAPGWKAGEPGWVAVTHRAWLRGQLAALETGGATVDRVVPAWAPDGEPAGHAYAPAQPGAQTLAWRDPDGLACLPLHGGGARTWVAGRSAGASVRWSASGDSAQPLAHLDAETVAARSATDLALAAAAWDGNLRQFDLAPQHRGSRLLRDGWRRFRSDRAWRPVRWGLVALVAVQLVGLNAWAWQQRDALARQKAAMASLLQGSFPHVRAVIDPGVQMQKEIELLRASAGRPGETDLEPMLQAVDAAWPPSRGPADSIKFEPGSLTLASAGWTPAEIDGLRSRLQPFGLDAEAAPGRLVISRLDPRRAPPAAAAAAPPARPPGPGAQGMVPPAAAQGASMPPPPGQPLPPPRQSPAQGTGDEQ